MLTRAHPFDFLGSDGIERWVAYPPSPWVLAFGGSLLGDGDPPRSR